jgi:hypothetical protein
MEKRNKTKQNKTKQRYCYGVNIIWMVRQMRFMAAV